MPARVRHGRGSGESDCAELDAAIAAFEAEIAKRHEKEGADVSTVMT